MTNKETVNRNIGLLFDFVREIIRNPSIADPLPDRCEIEFVEKDFPRNYKDHPTKFFVKVKPSFQVIAKTKKKKITARKLAS